MGQSADTGALTVPLRKLGHLTNSTLEEKPLSPHTHTHTHTHTVAEAGDTHTHTHTHAHTHIYIYIRIYEVLLD